MRRSRVRLILSLLLLLLAGGLGLHWWLVRHTEEILQELVRQESDGKVALQVTKARLRYRAHRVSLENVRLFSRDTAEEHAAFDLHFKSVDLQLASFSDMIFRGLLVGRLTSMTGTTSSPRKIIAAIRTCRATNFIE